MDNAADSIQSSQKLNIIQQIRRLLDYIMPTTGAKNEITSLDGLRALAVLLVVWLHVASFSNGAGGMPPPFLLAQLGSFGGYGVFLFFNLSGFLLFLPYARAILNQRSLPSIGKFYLRRILRILPLYYTVTLLLVFLKEPQFLNPDHRTILLLNLFMLGDARYDSFGAISSQFWTLSIEFQFYLILPLIAWILARVAGRHINAWTATRLTLGIVCLIAYGLIIRAFVDYYHYVRHIDLIAQKGIVEYITAILYGVDGKYIEIFALGIGVSFLYILCIEQKRISHTQRYTIGLITLLLAIVAAVTIGYVQTFFHLQYIWAVDMVWQDFGPWSTGCCCTILLVGVLFSPPLIQSIWSFYPLRFIGVISYGIYLWHFPLVQTLAPLAVSNHIHSAYIRLWFLGLAVSILFASATYYLVEKPFLKLRIELHQEVPQVVPRSASELSLQELQTVKRPALQLPIPPTSPSISESIYIDNKLRQDPKDKATSR